MEKSFEAIDRIAKELKSLTDERFSKGDDFIEFDMFPLIIDVCHVTGTLYLHDYGFGDGPEGIKDYYVGKYPASLLKRIPDAIKDLKMRLENS